MDRRGFLRRAVTAAAGVALAPIAAKLLPALEPLPAPPVWNEANPIFTGSTVQIDGLCIYGMLKPRFYSPDGDDFGVIAVDAAA